MACKVPPEGWWCSREEGHEGPCAARRTLEGAVASKVKAYDAALAELIEVARNAPPMTKRERAEQAANFAYGNVALTREYENASPEKLERLRRMCRKAAGLED